VAINASQSKSVLLDPVAVKVVWLEYENLIVSMIGLLFHNETLLILYIRKLLRLPFTLLPKSPINKEALS
jgi:hypothetical protein